MTPDQAECPGPRRRELRHGRQRQREELAGHHLEAAKGRTAHTDSQSPERPSVTVLRSLLVQPPTVKAQEVVKALRFGIEGMMEECRGSAGQCPYDLRVLPQFIEQDRQGEDTSVV